MQHKFCSSSTSILKEALCCTSTVRMCVHVSVWVYVYMDVYESLFALNSTPEVMLYEYAWDFYMENANWLELTSSTAYRSKRFLIRNSMVYVCGGEGGSIT